MRNRPPSLEKPSNAQDPFAVDLRSQDLRSYDLSQKGLVLVDYASFDTDTQWPMSLPDGFDPKRILELGREPGLGIRELHDKGITGKGVRVAFLDQTLLVDHAEYRDRLERYREIGRVPGEAQMHGAAVLSILAGKSIGVAPEVSVTYYAVQNVIDQNKVTWANHATAINEILDANAKLPDAERVRVIGVSWGYGPSQEGYEQIRAAVARAKEEGVFVLTTTVEDAYPFKFHGLGRGPLADPNDFGSYRPGSFWAERFYQSPDLVRDRILVPMDSRTTASPTGQDDYVFYRQGGLSWAVPYLVGVYALGLQVKPDLTPEEFYQAGLETGGFNEFERDGRTYRLGPILNPVELIECLQDL